MKRSIEKKVKTRLKSFVRACVDGELVRRFLGPARILMLALGLLPAGQAAAQLTPFGSCPIDAYQTLAIGNVFSLYRVNIGDGSLTLIGTDPLYSASVNAIGFNEDDGFIYGIAGNRVVRIGAGGQAEFLGPPVTGLPPAANLNSVLGDVRDGNLIIQWANGANGGQAEIALSGPNANSVINLQASLPAPSAADYAVNPLDENLYGVARNGALQRFNPATGVAQTIPGIVLPNPNNSFFGATYFDSEGTLYASRNDGAIFRILGADGSVTPTFEVLTTTAPPANANDGARCSHAAPPVASIHTRKGITTQSIPNNRADPGELLTYTVTATNTGLAGSIRPFSFFEVIPAGTTLNAINGAAIDCPTGSAGSRLCTVTVSANVPASGSYSFSLVFQVANTFPQGTTQIQNLVTDDTSNFPDGCTGTNQPCVPPPACDSTADPDHCVGLRVPTWDLRISKTNTPAQGPDDQAGDGIARGSATTYTLVVTNGGPDEVTGAVVSDTPSAGLDCPGANPVTCTSTASPNACPGGPLTVANLQAGVTLGTLPATASANTATFTFSCSVQ